MSACKHCSTPILKSTSVEFCCRGCESVYNLIHDEGLDLFYKLKSNDTLSPLRERPFQEKDWSWLQESANADTQESIVSLELGLSGMSCMACVWLVETAAKKHKGVLETCADNTQGSIDLTIDINQCDLAEVADDLFKLGYEILPKKLGKHKGTTDSLVMRLGICGGLAMNTMAFTLPRYNGMETSEDLSSLLTIIVVASSTLTLLVGGSYFFKRAWTALRLGGIHMDLPISLGLILSYVGSLIGWYTGHEALFYFDFVAIFTFLMLLGKQLQISSLNRANKRFQTDTTIPEFYRTPEGEQLDTENIPSDSVIIVPPGTVVPVESSLLAEKADLSLAWLTGEPSSQLFKHAAIIPAGAVNQSATPISVQTNTSTTEDNSIAKLLSTDTRQSNNTNKQAQQKAIQVYLAVIIVLGLVAGAAWLLVTGDWVKSFQVLISIYVVSCPCGIGLALPLLDTRSSKYAHYFGIFPLTSRFWEHLTRIGKVVFDKTGTLTLDKPQLTETTPLESLSTEHKEILFTLTRRSLHPLSRSLFSQLIQIGTTNSSFTNEVVETPGRGTSMTLDDGRNFQLGRNSSGHDAESLHCAFTSDTHTIRDFYFSESARSEATQAITAINNTLTSPCRILSGDAQKRVHELAKHLGIQEFQGDLLPHDKLEAIELLEKQQPVLYLGDGVNDLPALQAASLSGAPFANINMLTADVDFLFTDETMAFLPEMIRIGAQRRRRKLNLIAYTLLYNATVLIVAVLGLMSPLIAAIVMPLSSLLSIAIVSQPYQRNRS
ncbi:heavy metal translocating P-type ATPase [Rubritalea tangerina]|uniref:Heavy metal translocating P-type ATPase n=1 Tax=Rubritalea tangerina TaxID=430798 RepID=A0ABW4Z7W4_9BACT